MTTVRIPQGTRPRSCQFGSSQPSGVHMNWDQISGKWDQLKGEAKGKWGKLTNDDLMFVAGQRDKLVGKLQERYGLLEEQARKEVDEWITKVGTRIDSIGQPRRL
jgi:uncharacterized protein YjbJ (UPF0337 family)